MTDVWHALTRLEREALHAIHPHHTGNTQGATMNRLAETIKNDLAAAGHTVDDAVHQILAHRLNIVSVLQWTADEMNRFQGNPLADLVERYAGLPPAAVETVIHFADLGAQEAVKLLGGTPPTALPSPEPPPADPAQAQQ